MTKIGLTGSTGILGNSLIKLISLNKKYQLNNYKKNIISKKNLNLWVKKNQFDIIIHLAALVPTKKSKKNFRLSNKVNYQGTKNLIDAITKHQKKKTYLFFSSSSHVYSFTSKVINEKFKLKGISKYGEIKVKAERYIHKNQNKIDVCIGRISSLVSENQSKDFMLLNLINLGKKNIKINFKNANIKRNFIHVDDVSKIILKLINKKSTGIFNIASTQKTYLPDFFRYLNSKYKFNISYKKKKKEFLLLSNKLLLKEIGKFKFLNLNEIIKKIYKRF